MGQRMALLGGQVTGRNKITLHAATSQSKISESGSIHSNMCASSDLAGLSALQKQSAVLVSMTSIRHKEKCKR